MGQAWEGATRPPPFPRLPTSERNGVDARHLLRLLSCFQRVVGNAGAGRSGGQGAGRSGTLTAQSPFRPLGYIFHIDVEMWLYY